MDVVSKRGVISNIIGRERRDFQDYLNPAEVLNASNGDIKEFFLAYLSEVSARDDVSCVGTTGTGKAFSGGGDIASMI